MCLSAQVIKVSEITSKDVQQHNYLHLEAVELYTLDPKNMAVRVPARGTISLAEVNERRQAFRGLMKSIGIYSPDPLPFTTRYIHERKTAEVTDEMKHAPVRE